MSINKKDSSFIGFINLANKNRTLDFLNVIKDYFISNPESCSDWIHLCDPNRLRKKGISLPPLFANVQDVFGANYILNVNDHIGWHIFLRGYFDPAPALFAKLLSTIGHRGVYIDGGSNIGSTSIPVALDGIEVLGIEASNSTCSELLKNYSLNPSIKALAINAALCSPSQVSKSKYSELYRIEGNFAAGSLYKNWNNTGSKDFKEYTFNTTLDEIVNSFCVKEILMLKLDIEGYEYFALEGFQATLETMKPPVMFEWRPDHLMKTLGRVDDLRPLFPSGYKFYSIKYSKFLDQGVLKFGINLRTTDLSQPTENVVAICDNHFRYDLMENLQNSFVLI